MPDKFDPDERFKLDMEPEEAIRKFLDGDTKHCPRCGSELTPDWDELPDGSRRGTGVWFCPKGDYDSGEDA